MQKQQFQRSFLKWPGGKFRLLSQLLPLLPKANRFIEPFVGAGNVFINTDYKHAVIADANRDLINVYTWIKFFPDDLIKAIVALFESDLDYYSIRRHFNEMPQTLDVERAAEFIYLNRHCFNGICRYNSKGGFNVPEGKHKTIYLPEREIRHFSEKLNQSHIDICNDDYSYTIRRAGENDIIYCDPPYLSLPGKSSFTGYTGTNFSYKETEDLARCLYDAVKRGASAVISNHYTDDALYLFRQFNIIKVNAPRTISANGDRSSVREIIGVLTPDMI